MAGTSTNYGFTAYNSTAVTGVTSAVIRAGAGQGTTDLLALQTNGGTIFFGVNINTTDDYRLALAGTSGGANLGYIAGTGWLWSNGAAIDLVLGTVGAERMRIQASDPGVKFAATTKIGFFGATPVGKQTVTADAASILAALQAYGLAV